MNQNPQNPHPELRTFIERRMARSSGVASTSRSELRARIDELEAQLSFVTLFSRSLMEVLLEKNLTTAQDLVAIMERIDGLDGEEGDGLDPDRLAGELGQEPPRVDDATRRRRDLAAIQERSRRRRRPGS